jgi:hypothetical protein
MIEEILRTVSPLSGGKKTVLLRERIFVDNMTEKKKYNAIKIRSAILANNNAL